MELKGIQKKSRMGSRFTTTNNLTFLTILSNFVTQI